MEESIKYERINMQDYTVPYHVHNDYLEIIAESGLLAVIFYFGPLLIIVYLITNRFFLQREVSVTNMFHYVICLY